VVRQDGFSRAAAGDDIRLAWSDADEHQFNQITGARLTTATGDTKQVATG
jgi:hypothetical protein